MKLGCSTVSYLNLFETRKWTLWDFLDECARLKLDGVELQDRHFGLTSGRPSLEYGFWKRLQNELSSRKLEISAISPELYFDRPYETGKPVDTPRKIAEFKEWINVAYLLQVPYVRIFPTKIVVLRTLADYAGSHNVTLVMENHGAIVQNAEDHMSLVYAVNCPYLRVNLDTGNYPSRLYENVHAVVRSLTVRHVHLKHYGYHKGCKWIDNPKMIWWLKEEKYDGWLSIEYEGPRVDSSGRNLEREAVAEIAKNFRGRIDLLNKWGKLH